MRKLILIILIAIFSNTLSKASDIISNELNVYEDSLNYYFKKLASERNDAAKESWNEKILEYFRMALSSEESFDYNFDSLKNVGIIKSDDENLRIITWNLPYNDRTHKYFGFIQYKKSKRKILSFELNDQSDNMQNPDFAILNQNNWFGVLYYQIIENKYRGRTYYTLLGLDLNNVLTKKKVIDVLYLNSDDNLVFGKDVFKNRKRAVTRVIFEYSSQANMVLTYNKEKEMIVYDHLSPSKPSLQGQYEFYGPDFSYDGLKYERGIWNSYPNIDVRNYNVD